MDRVLVTGSSGQVGSYVVDALRERGRAVEGLDLRPSPWTTLVADVRAPPPLDEIDTIVHCAAQVSVPSSIEDPPMDASHNVQGTVAMLERARRLDARRVVLISSAAVYGNPVKLPCRESDPVAPLSPYGLSKLVGERYGAVYRELYGLDIVTLRPFNIFSPRQDPENPYSGAISRFVAAARAGAPATIFGDGSATRDFVHARDIVQAILLALEHPRAPGRVFNVGTGEATSIRALAEEVRAIWGAPMPRAGPPRAGDSPHSCADISALRALGYAPTTSLARDLREMGRPSLLGAGSGLASA